MHRELNAFLPGEPAEWVEEALEWVWASQVALVPPGLLIPGRRYVLFLIPFTKFFFYQQFDDDYKWQLVGSKVGDCQRALLEYLGSSGIVQYSVRTFFPPHLKYIVDQYGLKFRTATPRPSHALQVRFEIQTYTFSSLKVNQIKVSGESYKLYKGFRGRSLGSVEWRWW